MPVIFIAGLVTKIGFYVANQGKNLNSHGTSFYPPVVPGFSTSTNQKFMTGFSSGLTWPPSPISDMLTYSNKVSQTTLLRLTISPIIKGFVHIQSGALQQLSKIQLFSMKDMLQKFKEKTAVLECTALF